MYFGNKTINKEAQVGTADKSIYGSFSQLIQFTLEILYCTNKLYY